MRKKTITRSSLLAATAAAPPPAERSDGARLPILASQRATREREISAVRAAPSFIAGGTKSHPINGVPVVRPAPVRPESAHQSWRASPVPAPDGSLPRSETAFVFAAEVASSLVSPFVNAPFGLFAVAKSRRLRPAGCEEVAGC